MRTPIGDKEDAQAEMQRILVLGLMGDNGRNSVVLHLFPPAIARIMNAVEWAKTHPEAEHVEIVLHGEQPFAGCNPDALVMTMPRTALLALIADVTWQEHEKHGVTLQ